MFFENFYKICHETSVTETIFRKVLVIQNGHSHEHLRVSFPNTFLWMLPKIEQKRISLNDNIVWCKNSRVVKDLSNSGTFILFNVPKLFLFSLRANFTYF